jgi:uncharacterized protein DUF3828
MSGKSGRRVFRDGANVKGELMISSRRIVLARAVAVVAGFLLPAATFAQDTSAKAFLDAIYKAYVGKDTKGISLEGDAAMRRYFEPALAAMIIKDGKDAARRKEVPTLDGDPFVDAQDWEISAVNIEVADAGPGKAAGTVTFVNDTPKKVVLDLVKLKDGWRIADIHYAEGTLRGLFRKK